MNLLYLPLTCRRCHLTDPPPEQTCIGGRDHRVGIAAGCPAAPGCPACGRLIAACQRRPCSTRRERKVPGRDQRR